MVWISYLIVSYSSGRVYRGCTEIKGQTQRLPLQCGVSTVHGQTLYGHRRQLQISESAADLCIYIYRVHYRVCVSSQLNQQQQIRPSKKVCRFSGMCTAPPRSTSSTTQAGPGPTASWGWRTGTLPGTISGSMLWVVWGPVGIVAAMVVVWVRLSYRARGTCIELGKVF